MNLQDMMGSVMASEDPPPQKKPESTIQPLDKGVITDFRNKDIIWTASDYNNWSNLKDEVPYIYMKEFEQSWSSTVATVNRVFQRIRDANTEPYADLYLGTETGNEYYLPFFSEFNQQISQTWKENTDVLGSKAAKLVGDVTKLTQVVLPAASMVYPRHYTGGAPQSIPVSFTLFNTVVQNDGYNSIKKNKAFIERFVYRNLHAQHNLLSISPPSLYEVYIPGVRWAPAAVVSELTIKNRGTLNRIKEIGGGNYIVPDAWEVSFVLTELMNESRSIYQDAIQGRSGTGNMSIKTIKSVSSESEERNRTAQESRLQGDVRSAQNS